MGSIFRERRGGGSFGSAKKDAEELLLEEDRAETGMKEDGDLEESKLMVLHLIVWLLTDCSRNVTFFDVVLG